MKPVSRMTSEEAAGVRYVLLDIDDTITTGGKLSAAAYDTLWRLHEGGLKIVPVTGRPAGWCDLIAREWPVDGVIGENGALVFWEEPGKGSRALRRHFHPGAVSNDHSVLLRIKERALAEVPGLRVAKDQFARLFDLALDFAEEEPVLPLDHALRVRDIALEEGARAKVSSIHVNVWMGDYDKLSMAEWFLADRFGWQPGAGDREVVFAGDSPNDEPMFARFPLACGVANIRRYEGLIRHTPLFAASKESGEGFAEIGAALLEKRK
ncbi:MAG: HAD-IIB family hydrolase [Spirochaetaceae bacterium]|jgi:HAD superfamily hydrolase (TIGR01484 family)|nr:HAD-IIB family hydrolase [Spirochaetaceae bacterium]